MSSPLLAPLLLLVALLLSTVPRALSQSATTIYLSYTTSIDSDFNHNTQACGYAQLTCTGTDATNSRYVCSEVVSGTHYLYPHTGPNFLTQVTPFVTGPFLAACNDDANNTLPIDGPQHTMSFTLEGGGCVQLFYSAGDGLVHVSPSPVLPSITRVESFAYSTDVTLVPACPVYTPAYTTMVTYFTYLTGTAGAANSRWCGTGALLCNQSTVDTSVQSCRTLLNGSLYYYPSQYATTQVYTLTPARALNWHCYGTESDFLLPLSAGFSFYYTGADGSYGCQSVEIFRNTGHEVLYDVPNNSVDHSIVGTDISSFNYGSTIAAAGSCPAPNIIGAPGQILQATICFIFYATPGYLEYPWSSAFKLNVFYDSTPIGPNGAAVQLLNATGTRTFTNKYGSSFTTGITGLLPSSPNELFLTGQPVDNNGITLQLASSVQLPGLAPTRTSSQEILAANSNGRGVGEFIPSNNPDHPLAPVGLIDPVSVAVVSNIPGFTSITVGAGSLNSATVNYQSCTAAININNGLSNRPSSNIGATSLVYRYTYYITDGSFSVSSNMLITCSSASPQQDALGNYYQTIVAMNGTRVYVDGDFSVTSYIIKPYLWPTTSSLYSPNRIYPFSYSSSPPRAYTVASTPFLDVSGIQFVVDPPVAADDSLSYNWGFAAFVDDPDYFNSACYYSTPTDLLQTWAVGSGIYYTTEIEQATIPDLSNDPYVLLGRNDAQPYNFTGCGLNADGSIIYIIDANTNTLYASSSTSITLTTAATFGQEPLSYSPSLVVDSTNLFAYVAFASGHLYSVTLNPAASTYGQSYNTPTATYSQPITALTLSRSLTTLYFGLSATPTAVAAIRSVSVSAGTVSPLSGSTLLYSGGLLINPSSMAISAFGAELYITDGGVYYGGYAGGAEASSQYVFALDFLNLTHLAVEFRASDVGYDIRGGIFSDPNALTDGSQFYSAVFFAGPNLVHALSAYSVASISQIATQLSFGLTDQIDTPGTKPLQPQYQQQTLSIA